jgi:hypothetical protein
MKFASLLVAVAALASTACSSTPVRGVHAANEKTLAAQLEGKTPKEAVAILGQPISAFWDRDDKSNYSLIYPRTERSLTAMQFMMEKDSLECTAFNFEQENDYKFKGWVTHGVCSAHRDKRLDVSMIQ